MARSVGYKYKASNLEGQSVYFKIFGLENPSVYGPYFRKPTISDYEKERGHVRIEEYTLTRKN